MIAWIRSSSRWLILILLTAPLWGCVVGQAPGKGKLLHTREPSTNAGYWLYLPDGYDPAAPPGARGPRRPVVVSFHGMKPFDNARSQAREWQQEAGFTSWNSYRGSLAILRFSYDLKIRIRG